MEVNRDLVVKSAASARNLDRADRRPGAAIRCVQRLKIAHALIGRVPVVLEDDVVIPGGVDIKLRALRTGRSGKIPAVAGLARGGGADDAPGFVVIGADVMGRGTGGSELRVVFVTLEPSALPTLGGDIV